MTRKKHDEPDEDAGTIQKSVRMPVGVPHALNDLAARLNKTRDTMVAGKLDATKLINLAVRDLLESHGEFGHYPPSGKESSS